MNFLSIKTLKNWHQKLLIIGPEPFISQSSPDHSPKARIDFSYYAISGPDICSLIPGQTVQFFFYFTKLYLKYENFHSIDLKASGQRHFDHRGLCDVFWSMKLNQYEWEKFLLTVFIAPVELRKQRGVRVWDFKCSRIKVAVYTLWKFFVELDVVEMRLS